MKNLNTFKSTRPIFVASIIMDAISVIKLLPEHISNQIAAGEVVQRPSNIIKELMENSIDAGAKHIQVTVHHGGKSSIEIKDNGTGMSKMDVRMAFERHATSKIKTIEDLFQIRTMGFRGEALASIGAVAKVELITKTASEDVGSFIEVDNGKVLRQESSPSETGTSIVVRNLFFHVPARKHFLKSDATEFKHIVVEFLRIAFAYPDVYFTLTHHQEKIYQLPPVSLKQRIIQVYGKSYDQQLTAVNEESHELTIRGFVGKPPLARKKRNDNFLIINKRFVRCPIIHRAVINAYGNMLASDEHPFYILHIDIDPASIDINIHPSKQEIKFTDERWIYTFIQSHIRYALAKNNVTTSLQFDLDENIQSLDIVQTGQNTSTLAESKISKSFNSPHKAHYLERDWHKEIDNIIPKINTSIGSEKVKELKSHNILSFAIDVPFNCIQILKRFLMVEQNQYVFLIDLLYTHEMIMYDHFLKKTVEEQSPSKTSQSFIDPLIVSLSPSDMQTALEQQHELKGIGFHFEQIGINEMIFYACPSEIEKQNLEAIFLSYLEEMKFSTKTVKPQHQSIYLLAKSISKKKLRPYTQTELNATVRELFALEQNEYSLDGHPIIKVLQKDDFVRLLRSV